MQPIRALFRKAARFLTAPSPWCPPLMLVLLTLVFFERILFTNRAIIPWDAGDFFLPLLGFVHEELRHFRLPWWTPYSFAGYPVIADPEAQTFYPVNWLMTLSQWSTPFSYRALEIQIVLHYYLAGLTMYWLVNDWTKRRLPAITAGAIYMFSGPLATHAQHQSIVNALAWFPLVFLLARRSLHGRDWRSGAWAGVAFGMVCLVGHYQHVVYLGLLLFLYFFYEACFGPDRRLLWPHWMLALGCIAVIGAGLAMVQLVPAAELSQFSLRSQLTPPTMAGARDPRYLWTFFLPNFFGEYHGAQLRLAFAPSFQTVFISVPGCILTLVGLVEMARRRNIFWLGMIVVFSLASLGENGPFYPLVYQLPLLKLFRNMFILVNLAIFSVAVMAGIGAASLEDEKTRGFHLRWLRPFVFVSLAFGVYGGVRYGWLAVIPEFWYMLVGLGIMTLLILAWPEDAPRLRAVQWTVLILACAELFHFHMKKPFNAEPADPRRIMSFDYLYYRKEELTFLRADTSGDFRIANTMGWPTNHWNLVRIPAAYGWNPLLPRRYNEYVRQFMQTNGYAFADAGPDNNLASGMQDLLGIKYYLTVSARETEMQMGTMPNLRKVHDGVGWYKIYENPGFLSRTWFFDRAYVVPDYPAALALMNSSWFAARKALILERADVPASPGFPTEELTAYVLPPASEASSGALTDDVLCAEPRKYRAHWGHETADWQRYPLPKDIKPGRYLLSGEYLAYEYNPQPVIQIEVRQGDRLQNLEPVKILRTAGSSCAGKPDCGVGRRQHCLRPRAHNVTRTSARGTAPVWPDSHPASRRANRSGEPLPVQSLQPVSRPIWLHRRNRYAGTRAGE